MSENRSNTSRLAREYSKRAGIGYQQALAEVKAAQQAGALPGLYADENLEEGVSILEERRVSKTASRAVDLQGVVRRLQRLAAGDSGGVIAVAGPVGTGKAALIAKLAEGLLGPGMNMVVITSKDRLDIDIVTEVHQSLGRPTDRGLISIQSGEGTVTTALAIRSAMRMRPDILVLDDALKANEAMREAFIAAGCGALVILSLNTPSAESTVTRLITAQEPGDPALLESLNVASVPAAVSKLLLGVTAITMTWNFKTRERRCAYEILGTSPELRQAILEYPELKPQRLNFDGLFSKNPESVTMAESLKALKKEGFYNTPPNSPV